MRITLKSSGIGPVTLLVGVGIFLGLFQALASAQGVPGADVAIADPLPLDAGERAPHAGMLVLDDDLEALQSRLHLCLFDLHASDDLHHQVCDSLVAIEHARTTACADSAELHDRMWSERATQWAAQLAAAQRSAAREWWESPALWALVGGAVVAAISVALAVAFGGG
jgi:hypothetical protein